MNTNKLNYDGKIYTWNGSFSELKSFVEQHFKFRGSWKSPGGEAKTFRSEQSEFVIKWHGVTSKKIVIQADDKERYLELLLQSLATVQKSNEAVKTPEVVSLAESCGEDALIAETNTGTAGEVMQGECDQKSLEETTKMTGVVEDTENYRSNAQRVCSCNCKCGGGVVSAEIEGIKLDMAILESRLLSAFSLNEPKPDFNSLEAKQKDMEAVIRKQDELICNINDENMVLKSKLFSIEHLMLQIVHKNSAGNDEINNPKENENNACNDGINNSKENENNADSPLANEIGMQQESNFSRVENEMINKLKHENLALKLQLQNATFDKTRSKSLTPCPFLKRRGWCVKGDRCDFQHPIQRRDNDKHRVPCPFLRRNGYCLKGNSCDFFHGGLPYPRESRFAPEVQPHPYNPFWSNYQSPIFPIFPPKIPPWIPPCPPQMPRFAQPRPWPTPTMEAVIHPPVSHRT